MGRSPGSGNPSRSLSWLLIPIAGTSMALKMAHVPWYSTVSSSTHVATSLWTQNTWICPRGPASLSMALLLLVL